MRENSAEYRTLIQHTSELKAAVRWELSTLSLHLYNLELISWDNFNDLMNMALSKAERSALLVELVQNRVQQDPRHYHTFIGILQNYPVQYWDIVQELEDTYTHEKEDSKIYVCVHVHVHDL